LVRGYAVMESYPVGERRLVQLVQPPRQWKILWQMGQNPGHAHAQEQTPLLIVHAKLLMQNAYFQ